MLLDVSAVSRRGCIVARLAKIGVYLGRNNRGNDVISHDVSIKLFQKVNPPHKIVNLLF